MVYFQMDLSVLWYLSRIPVIKRTLGISTEMFLGRAERGGSFQRKSDRIAYAVTISPGHITGRLTERHPCKQLRVPRMCR